MTDELKLPEKLTPAQRKRLKQVEDAEVELDEKMIAFVIGKEGSVDQKQAIIREADFILRSLENPLIMATKLCKECGGKFGADYASVGFCSNNCRAAALLRVGITFDPTKSDTDRYDGKIPPSVISAETFAKLVRLLEHLTGPLSNPEPVVVEPPKPEKPNGVFFLI